MKRIWYLLLPLALGAARLGLAQDAATEERLNKLSGQIEDLMAAKTEQDKKIAGLARQVETLREQLDKPVASYPSHDDLKRLADGIKEVDQKRLEDYDKIRAELLKLGKTLAASPPPKKSSAPAPVESAAAEKASTPEKGFEYTIKRGDTLSLIVQAYREQKIKVTTEQILKANPGLKPERLAVGKKIFIPAPQL